VRITRRTVTGLALAGLATGAIRGRAAEQLTAPPLWSVQRGSSKVYLFGQMGVRADSVWLTDGVRRAFESSTELWVENPEFPPPPTGAPAPAEPPKGPKLSEVATPQDLKRVRSLLLRAGLSANTFDTLLLSAAYPAISDAADRAFGVDYTALPERVMKSRAKVAGKPVHSEWASLEEITRFMTDLPDDLARTLQLQLVRKTLDESGDVKAAERRLNQWLSGDMEGWNAFDAHMASTYPELRKRIGTERNKAWVPRVDALLARTHAAFVCVGILHLAGTESIQAQLKRSGLAVLRV
jgi:uncharacterized protein YbaP (TraB family)